MAIPDDYQNVDIDFLGGELREVVLDQLATEINCTCKNTFKITDPCIYARPVDGVNQSGLEDSDGKEWKVFAVCEACERLWGRHDW